jgi:glycosyltransferase involved in cell wall biosynthesis
LNDDARGRKRICFVTPLPLTINAFLRGHIDALKTSYDVTLVSNGSAGELAGVLGDHVSFVPIRIERRISIAHDLRALFTLWRFFRAEKFDSVHSITPKVGLLSMLAARGARIPRRFHTFTGQVWATQTGLRRFVLKSLDRVLGLNATRLLADSHSQRLFLIQNGVVKAPAIGVLAEGSVSGVDSQRFAYSAEVRARIRGQYGIPRDAVVFLFVGRLSRDKGVIDLSRAFATAAKKDANIHLMIVGPDEAGLQGEFSALAQRIAGRVHRVGLVDRPEHFMAAADVCCLPSYREGFGMVLIEAASVGLPAIASRIYGITDAVEDGVTGLLHRPTSDREISEAMLLLAADDGLRRRMGEAARQRVIDRFSEARVTGAVVEFYRNMLSEPASR